MFKPKAQKTIPSNANFGVNAPNIEFLYKIMLQRAPKKSEIDYYLEYARNNDLDNIADLSAFFINSAEFQKANRVDKKTVWSEFKTVTYDGLNLSLPVGDFTELSISDNRLYEPYVSTHLLDNLTSTKCFIDVGANLGLFALPVARRLAPRGHVYAFEASAKNANLLQANAKANGISNISVYPVAVGDRNGSVFSQINDSTSNKSVFLDNRKVDNIEILPLVRLDNFWNHKIKVDMIKIDIEGFEYRFFVGANKVVSDSHPKIYIEYADSFQRSGSGVPGEKLLNLLLEHGYTLTILHRAKQPELVIGTKSEIVEAVDGALQRHISDDRGTHLDLYLEIAG